MAMPEFRGVNTGWLRGAATGLVVLAVALPWLNPFAPGPSPATLPLLFSWACAVVLLWACGCVLASSVAAGRLVPVVAWAWLGAGLLSSVMGLCQYLGAGDSLLPWVNQTVSGHAFANLRQRNQFASLANMALMALIWFAMSGRLGRFTVGHSRTLWLLAASVLAAANAASSSRTGLLQLVLLCVLCGLWGGLRKPVVRGVLLTAVVAYALATVALPWLAGLDLAAHGMFARLHAGDPACASRLTLWSNVLHLIAQKPWLGWGWGELDYAHYITLYDGPRFCEILDNAHNLPLHLAVELGVPAALLLCGGLLWWVWRQQPWRELDATRQLAWAVLALIGLHSLLEYPLWYGPFQMAAGLCVLMLWQGPGVGFEQKFKINRPLALAVLAQTAIVLIAIAGYAMWDYHRISQIYRAPEARDAAYRDDTLAKIRNSWLFGRQVRFAELSITGKLGSDSN